MVLDAMWTIGYVAASIFIIAVALCIEEWIASMV